MKKLMILSALLILAISGELFAQAPSTVITGKVRDQNGPLASATVIEKGAESSGVAADAQGNFRISLKGTSRTLIFSNLGYVSQEIELDPGQNTLEIVMEPNEQGMDQVVVVGYGKKKRLTNTGAVSSISGDVIRNIPTSSVQNTLQGKVPGVFSVQRGGQPGRDASDFFIRGVSSLNPGGNRPLIIVDDIEYTYEQLSQINVNEIENISVLKDASTTAIYGIKGANGVLIVTTRRGAVGKPKVNLRVESGIQSPTKRPTFLNSYETALLVNEGLMNDGKAPQFTQQDLDLFRSGEDPYGHPDVNWYDVVFKPYSMQANTNVDISGGAEKVKYFISAGAFTQNGNLRDFTDPRNQGVNSKYLYNRYNFRSNLDLQVTNSLKLRLDVTGRFGRINEPLFKPFFGGRNASGIMQEIYDFRRITPYAAPVMNPNGSYPYAYGPNLYNEPTINARLSTMGYNRTSRSDYNVLFGATQNLDAITKGLSFEARVAYATTSDIVRRVQREGPVPAYHYDPVTGAYTLSADNTYTLSKYSVYAGNNIYDKRLNLQAFLNYDRTFDKHHIYSMALLNQNDYTAAGTTTAGIRHPGIPEKFQGFTFKLGYEFDNKYLMDFNLGYNGSDRFQEGNRYGLFPALGVGWNISEEDFFTNTFSDFFQLFKIRASYGLVGSDAVIDNRYLYEQLYLRGGSYSFGQVSNVVTGIYEGGLGNPNVTWEKARKFDVGLDLNMFRDKISVTVDYFNDYRFDQLYYPGSVPSLIGVGFARENLAIVRNKGWDGQVAYRDNIGQMTFDITGVFSIAKNEILEIDESAPAYPWLARTGNPIGQPFGYINDGFYADEADILKSARPNIPVNTIHPGDLKYRDLNEDGIIDERDMGPIGSPDIPTTSIGLTLGAQYKGLSLSVLFQGAFGYSFAIRGIGIEPFQGQMQPVHQMRWTPDNTTNATFPRLTSNASGISSPSAYPSTFWYVDGKYIRMKTVEAGYQLPTKLLPFKISNLRLYLSAYNLLTWSNFSLYQQDPEVSSNTAGDAYLNQKVVNFGLQVGF